MSDIKLEVVIQAIENFKHTAIKSKLFNDSEVEALTWNISPNKKLDQDQYMNQTEQVASKLNTAIKENKEIGIIALQGVSKIGYQSLIDKIVKNLNEMPKWKDNITIKFEETDQTGHGVLTLFNNQLLDYESSDKPTTSSIFTPHRLKLKTGKSTTDNVFYFANLHLVKPEPSLSFKKEFSKTEYGNCQIIIAGDFNGVSSDGIDKASIVAEKNVGFVFKENPQAYSFPQKTLPIVVEGDFTSRVKKEALEKAFNIDKKSKIDFKENQAIITNLSPQYNDEKVAITKEANNKLTFTASHSSDSTLDLLFKAAEMCLAKDSKVQIIVSGDENDTAVKDIKNKTWLGLVKKGLKTDYKPDEAFLQMHKDELHSPTLKP